MGIVEIAPHPGTPPHEALLSEMSSIAEGDALAFARLYARTSGAIYALALRIVRNVPMAEEVVADVYLQAWRNARGYEAQRGGVMAWLMMMCRSRALDALRLAGRRVPIDASDGGESPDPCDLLEATQRGGQVHAALSALPPLQRQLLALAFFRGCTHAEIAERMGLPLGTVKSLIRRTLVVLHETLDG